MDFFKIFILIYDIIQLLTAANRVEEENHNMISEETKEKTTLSELFELLMNKSPSSLKIKKIELVLYISFFIYSIIYIIEYILLKNKLLVGKSYFTISCISSLLILIAFYFHLLSKVKKEQKIKYIKVNDIRNYLRNLDINYYIQILKTYNIDTNTINEYISLYISNIPYYGINLATIVISSFISTIFNTFQNNPQFAISIFIIFIIILNPIITVVAKLNNKITKQKASDIKYVQTILLEVKFKQSL